MNSQNDAGGDNLSAAAGATSETRTAGASGAAGAPPTSPAASDRGGKGCALGCPRQFFRSIKGKIFILFAVTFISIGALAALNYWSLSTVSQRLLLGERYDDLLNNILEVRRYEKNYLFYRDAGSLTESLAYLERIDALTAELADDMAVVAGQAELVRFRDLLARYGHSVRTLVQGGTANQEELRTLGKSLIDEADALRKQKRERAHKALERTLVLPLAFLAVFLLLMVLVIKLISTGLLRPLDMVAATTGRVGRGDFSPIATGAEQLSEIASFIHAFNRMAHELAVNQEHLLQARKMAALGTFTAGIAHELNNPINNVLLSAEGLREDYGDAIDADGQEMIGDIMQQAERASDIVRNLLDFSRTEHPTFTALHPVDVIGSTVSLLKNQVMLSGISLAVHVPADLPMVRGDLRSLQQVFMNLLLNGIQATPRGGAVAVVAMGVPPGHVAFEVRDSGPGIPEEIREHIFEPFFSTKEVGKGTGLGLAVTYALVHRHEGRIEVHGGEGRGAVFTVLLPVARPGGDRESGGMIDDTAFEEGDA
ncbi:ATP-binding protein [Nitratidesulfovibrio sp. SRB-5]|uniref:sensor histidine kinase n=1 Tax=Nitratidesulfovibrio sp. SRB-5 TaxID=2872636 RepID=UPI001028269F|nr:ATP-binding protein [Nitratidesulfovibrio sp. SRB-5]MBZ2172543.1 HAMP domain-containing histidine kinase [Nitratidesulfovibrio sp. SRB-5]RXF77106.1 HAMP domain-containing protein [Desulfovibrio sp. DS-1]